MQPDTGSGHGLAMSNGLPPVGSGLDRIDWHVKLERRCYNRPAPNSLFQAATLRSGTVQVLPSTR